MADSGDALYQKAESLVKGGRSFFGLGGARYDEAVEKFGEAGSFIQSVLYSFRGYSQIQLRPINGKTTINEPAKPGGDRLPFPEHTLMVARLTLPPKNSKLSNVLKMLILNKP